MIITRQHEYLISRCKNKLPDGTSKTSIHISQTFDGICVSKIESSNTTCCNDFDAGTIQKIIDETSALCLDEETDTLYAGDIHGNISMFANE
jgi:hypothetical protein